MYCFRARFILILNSTLALRWLSTSPLIWSFVQEGANIWSYLATRFRAKLRMQPGSEETADQFLSLLQRFDDWFNLILDEADTLMTLSPEQLRHFLLFFREIKEDKLHAFVLLGTYALPSIVSTDRWPEDKENSLWDARVRPYLFLLSRNNEPRYSPEIMKSWRVIF